MVCAMDIIWYIILFSFAKYCIADCYYDTTDGGCVILSLPDVQGNCLNYYKSMINAYTPIGCYDGYYSSCTCAIYNPTSSCASFATYGTVRQCPQNWVDVGSGIISTLPTDSTCFDTTTQFVAGPNNDCGTCPCDSTTPPASVIAWCSQNDCCNIVTKVPTQEPTAAPEPIATPEPTATPEPIATPTATPKSSNCCGCADYGGACSSCDTCTTTYCCCNFYTCASSDTATACACDGSETTCDPTC